MSGDGSVLEALSGKLGDLANGAFFTVAEFTATGVTVWTVTRDDKGTPELPRYREFRNIPETDPDALNEIYDTQIAPALGHDLLLIAHPAAETYPQLLSLLISEQRAPAYECHDRVKDLIRSAITTTPLRDGYELVVLREGRSGQLSMDLTQLIPQDATSGYSTDFRIRCAPTDDKGTVFAVMIRDRGAGVTPASPRLRPIEIQSGKIPPGEYDVSARLVRPGHVEFHGLPANLTQDARPWREIRSTVPASLPKANQAHLVCMLEVSGAEHLEHRIERLEELINAVEAGGRVLSVSLVTYGPHAVSRPQADDSATVLTWATTSDLALRQLATLKNRVPPENEYPRAAQLECALLAVAGRFAGRHPERDGEPVLVTAGTRPPHPERVDINTEIIPCPHKVSWRRTLSSLSQTLPGLKFGALCSAGAVGSVWRSLGRDTIEEVDVVDVPAFAAKLGLRDTVLAVPFPLI
jgi:hypothetical protein